eukprot:Clim_evm62s225 gene=Clim_evmTU62s225
MSKVSDFAIEAPQTALVVSNSVAADHWAATDITKQALEGLFEYLRTNVHNNKLYEVTRERKKLQAIKRRKRKYQETLVGPSADICDDMLSMAVNFVKETIGEAAWAVRNLVDPVDPTPASVKADRVVDNFIQEAQMVHDYAVSCDPAQSHRHNRMFRPIHSVGDIGLDTIMPCEDQPARKRSKRTAGTPGAGAQQEVPIESTNPEANGATLKERVENQSEARIAVLAAIRERSTIVASSRVPVPPPLPPMTKQQKSQVKKKTSGKKGSKKSKRQSISNSSSKGISVGMAAVFHDITNRGVNLRKIETPKTRAAKKKSSKKAGSVGPTPAKGSSLHEVLKHALKKRAKTMAASP